MTNTRKHTSSHWVDDNTSDDTKGTKRRNTHELNNDRPKKKRQLENFTPISSDDDTEKVVVLTQTKKPTVIPHLDELEDSSYDQELEHVLTSLENGTARGNTSELDDLDYFLDKPLPRIVFDDTDTDYMEIDDVLAKYLRVLKSLGVSPLNFNDPFEDIREMRYVGLAQSNIFTGTCWTSRLQLLERYPTVGHIDEKYATLTDEVLIGLIYLYKIFEMFRTEDTLLVDILVNKSEEMIDGSKSHKDLNEFSRRNRTWKDLSTRALILRMKLFNSWLSKYPTLDDFVQLYNNTGLGTVLKTLESTLMDSFPTNDSRCFPCSWIQARSKWTKRHFYENLHLLTNDSQLTICIFVKCMLLLHPAIILNAGFKKLADRERDLQTVCVDFEEDKYQVMVNSGKIHIESYAR